MTPAQAALQMAQAQISAGNCADAEALYRRLLIQYPTNADLFFALAMLASKAARLPESVSLLSRAVSLSPNNGDYRLQLGLHHRKAGNLPGAIASLQRAVALKPGDAQFHFILANALQTAGEFEQSIVSYRRALAIKPDYAEALGNVGSASKAIGLLDEAITCYRRAIELKPDGIVDHDNLVLTLLYHPNSTPKSLFDESVRWNAQHSVPLRPLIQSHTNTPDPDRSLRIGYVSPDFRDHPVGRFMQPLLERHDRSRFEIFCYSNSLQPDEFTRQLMATGHAWREIRPLSDTQAADLIRADQIDILVNLALHTGKNRLLVFAQKPAPVQVAYLGYAGGCGLDTIDYMLTDRYLELDHSQESYSFQKPVKLAGSYWCYQPLPINLPVGPLPAMSNGYLTFGCLNNFAKLTDVTLLAWAALLRSLEGSRLLLHVPPGDARRRVSRFLLENGVEADRVTYVDRVGPADYLATFNQIDIGLDPFPFSGGTTSCDAMWMGVPVVTLAGNTPVGRAGVSILSNVGLPDLISCDLDQYAKIATGLAADLPRLAAMRASLRKHLQTSPLMDAVGYTKSIEAAYRSMWRTWCEPR